VVYNDASCRTSGHNMPNAFCTIETDLTHRNTSLMNKKQPPNLNRREFVAASAATAATLAGGLVTSSALAETHSGNLHLGTFRFDVTLPMGHSLCGGWIKPFVAVDDPL